MAHIKECEEAFKFLGRHFALERLDAGGGEVFEGEKGDINNLKDADLESMNSHA